MEGRWRRGGEMGGGEKGRGGEGRGERGREGATGRGVLQTADRRETPQHVVKSSFTAILNDRCRVEIRK